ncbi:HTH domain-containing protein [Hwanghaeella sp.]|uniref:HTH domain-containing protein n=1 Tax=Hwanghaeella sp. TaxID=2605943 RepID=UPI003CCC1454
MDSLISAAARFLARGDALSALKHVALRDDPPALALRGIAMAQMGDLDRARDLLRRAARAFGTREPAARARCLLAEAEIALVCRDLARAERGLAAAQADLLRYGDVSNAAHAAYLDARRLLLIGKLDQAEQRLSDCMPDDLPPASRVGFWLVIAGLAMRRVQAGSARTALQNAATAARQTGIPALIAEADHADRQFGHPAARVITRDGDRLVDLAEVETLLASDILVVDACRNAVHRTTTTKSLASRPVLFTLLRALAEAWPADATRATLLLGAFGSRHADESQRARLRVEIGRLRKAIAPFAEITASPGGFRLVPMRATDVAVLAPPEEGEYTALLALLADGEAWTSSALAQAMDVSPRTIQRALQALARTGKVESFGQGRACRWIAAAVPGFPTSLLLPAVPPSG